MKNQINLKAGLSHLKLTDPVLAQVISKFAVPDFTPRKKYFQSLVRSVISQQLSTKAASTIGLRFKNLFPKKTFPTAQDVLETSDSKLRSVGLSGSKVKYIKAIAQAFSDKIVNPRKFITQTDEEIIKELIQIKGVGRWTAEMFLMFSLGRPDVFSHGDLGLKNAIKNLYGFKETPTPEKIEKIVLKWSPHRTIASRYLWLSLDNKK